jgi:HSP20 family molecular chaperone IbpA
MSGIRELDKHNLTQIEASRRRLEQRIKNIQNVHEEYEADIRKAHNDQIVDLQKTNQFQIARENEKKEKVLEEVKSNLQQAQSLADKELYELKDFSQRQKSEMHKKYALDRERISDENEIFLEDLNEHFNVASEHVDQTGKMRLQNMNSKMQDQVRNLREFHENKIERDVQQFSDRARNNEINYLKVKNQQDQGFRKERKMAHLSQEAQIQKISEIHSSNLENLDRKYREGLKDQEVFFEGKFKNQFEQQNASFKRIEEKNKVLLQDLKNNLTKEITKMAERNDDPFYRFEAIKPRLKELDDRIVVEVDIPEYSKQDVQLSLNEKEAIVNFSRRFHDASRMDDGTINKVNKVESYTTRLPTQRPLDHKTIQSHYENGMMIFTVKYA